MSWAQAFSMTPRLNSRIRSSSRIDERLVRDHRDQDVLHARQRPGPLEQREAETDEHGVVAAGRDDPIEGLVARRVVGIGELEAADVLRRHQAVADHADILVDPPVPLDAELVPPRVRLHLGIAALGPVRPQPREAIAQLLFEIRIAVVFDHPGVGRLREPNVIRDLVRRLVPQRRQHTLSIGHVRILDYAGARAFSTAAFILANPVLATSSGSFSQ